MADTLDAMAHDRPSRRARPVAEALGEVRREAGRVWGMDRWLELRLRQRAEAGAAWARPLLYAV